MVLGLTLFKICEVRKFPFAIAILDRRTLCITIPKNIILNKIKSSKIAKPSIICISQYIHTTCTTGKFCCPSVNFPFRKVTIFCKPSQDVFPEMPWWHGCKKSQISFLLRLLMRAYAHAAVVFSHFRNSGIAT